MTLRHVNDTAAVVASEIVREVPGAQTDLPSPALGTAGGGSIAIDPTSLNTPRSLEPLFHFDVSLPAGDVSHYIGARVFVRFDHGAEGIAFRAVRAGRQLFLSQFGV